MSRNVVESLGLARVSAQRPLRVVAVRLTQFKAVTSSMYCDPTVSPQRLVYEITTRFSTPFSVGGQSWTSGWRVFAVDAQTGDVFFSDTSGAGFETTHRKLAPGPG